MTPEEQERRRVAYLNPWAYLASAECHTDLWWELAAQYPHYALQCPALSKEFLVTYYKGYKYTREIMRRNPLYPLLLLEDPSLHEVRKEGW